MLWPLTQVAQVRTTNLDNFNSQIKLCHSQLLACAVGYYKFSKFIFFKLILFEPANLSNLLKSSYLEIVFEIYFKISPPKDVKGKEKMSVIFSNVYKI